MKSSNTGFIRGSLLLSVRCRYAGRRFLLARLRLYRSCIVWVGLGWKGFFQRVLPLAQIARVDWRTVQREPNLLLHLHNGEVISSEVQGAALLKYAIEEHAPNLTGADLRPSTRISTTA